MKRFIFCSKVFAVSTLIFLNFSSVFAQPDSTYVLPAGKRIRVRMETEVSSKVASLNDTFLVRISQPVSNGGSVVLPVGTIIDGRVTRAKAADLGVTNGKLDVTFDRLRFSREEAIVFDARLIKPLKAPSRGIFTFLTIAGLTTAGAVFGAASSARNGTLIGAAAGAGTGSGIALLRKGNDVRIKTNEEFEIELKRDIVLPAREY